MAGRSLTQMEQHVDKALQTLWEQARDAERQPEFESSLWRFLFAHPWLIWDVLVKNLLTIESERKKLRNLVQADERVTEKLSRLAGIPDA